MRIGPGSSSRTASLGLHGYADLRGRWLDPDQPRPDAYIEGLWGFLLKDLPGSRTRLVISGYQAFRPRWVERYLIPWLLPLVWLMQARMMVVLKRTIEHPGGTDPSLLGGSEASRRGPAPQ